MKTILLVLLVSLGLSVVAQKEHYLLVGTYTSGNSEGIYVYKFNSETGKSELVSSAKIKNPSYLTVSPSQKFVYAVTEEGDGKNNGGGIASFSFDKTTGQLKELNTQLSAGDHPCYVTIDKTGKWVIAGNYTSGTVAVLPVRKDGSLDSASNTQQHEGYSVNSERQTGPHVHATVLDKENKYLFVPDLGIDRVMIYTFNNKTGLLAPAEIPYEQTEPGAGPRHFDFHPNGKFAYLIEEMTGSVSVYGYNKGELSLKQNISALPGEYDGPVGSADIHVSPDGEFLYVSNRGESNTIAIFKINKSQGTIHIVSHQSTMGKTPRNFNFDPTGKFLLVANQNSDEIVIFERDRKTGLLTDTQKRIAVSKPVCIKWIPAK